MTNDELRKLLSDCRLYAASWQLPDAPLVVARIDAAIAEIETEANQPRNSTMSETDQTLPKVTNADFALADKIARRVAAKIIAAYRVDRARQSLGIVREVIDNYRAEAVARGDKKTVNWIDRCLEAAEKPGE